MTENTDGMRDRRPLQPVDPALRLLVASFARVDDALPMTLATTSGVLTGDLAGVNRWWRELSDLHGAALPGLMEAMGGTFSLPTFDTEEETGAFDETLTWSHIHLTNARYVTGTGAFPAEGFPWRGRLSMVVGWSIGSLSAGPP
jgi:hypothetical protein